MTYPPSEHRPDSVTVGGSQAERAFDRIGVPQQHRAAILKSAEDMAVAFDRSLESGLETLNLGVAAVRRPVRRTLIARFCRWMRR